MTHEHEPDVDNTPSPSRDESGDSGSDDNTDNTDGAPDAAETAPEGGLFDKLTNILGGNHLETAKVDALTLAAQGYAMGHRRAVEILEGLDPQTQMELVQKGVTGIELSTFQKILLVVNPGFVIFPEAVNAAWNGFKRNTLARITPDAWINDVSWLASQAEVVAMFSTGVVHSKNPEIAQAADQVLGSFIKNTSTAARVAEVGGALVAQPEIVEGAQIVKKGAEIAQQVVTVFPKVREKMEAKRTEVAATQEIEHDKVAQADPVADIKPITPERDVAPGVHLNDGLEEEFGDVKKAA